MTPTHRIRPWLLAAGLAGLASAAQADSNVALYGDIDLYGNYMSSSSGNHIVALDDGALLRSRWGMRGNEDLGGGYAVKFQLEGGFYSDTGGLAGNGLFDRQSWVGIASSWGELRAGRQNGPIFTHGDYIDFTRRTLGSVINDFGVPARFDNDIAYLSPRSNKLQFEAHVSLPEATVGNHPLVIQASVDYVGDTIVAGAATLHALPPTNALVNKDVEYDHAYVDWKYGQGTVYLAFVRSNNITSSAVSKTAGTILSNVGGYNAGTNADLAHFYDIWQVSADCNVTPQLRVGALWGRIVDTSGRDQGAQGGSAGAYYDLSKRTTLLALVDTIRNESNGGFRPAGSAALHSNFTSASDVNGRRINGIQLGMLHRF
jgi:predicted porin